MMEPVIAIAEITIACFVHCNGRNVEGECENCEIETAFNALRKQIPFEPETDHLKIGVGRCKCGVEFLDKKTNYCGNCGQKLRWKEERSENEQV